jgi:WD40 repeat protein
VTPIAPFTALGLLLAFANPIAISAQSHDIPPHPQPVLQEEDPSAVRIQHEDDSALGQFAFSNDGKSVLTTYQNPTIWSSETAKPIKKLNTGFMRFGCFLPGDAKIIYCDSKHRLIVYDVGENAALRTIIESGQKLFEVSVSPNKKLLAVRKEGGRIAFYDIASFQLLRSVQHHGSAHCWLEEGSSFLVNDAGISQLEIATGSTKILAPLVDHNVHYTITPPEGSESYISFTLKDSVAAMFVSTNALLDVKTGKILKLSTRGSHSSPAAFSNDGQLIAFWSETSVLEVQEVSTGKGIFRAKLGRHHGQQVKFQPYAARFAYAPSPGVVEIRDLSTEQQN